VGQAISSLGDAVGTFALIARAFDLTGSPTAVGGVLVLRLGPPLVAAPLGGILADRLDRRVVLATTNVAMGALIVLAPFVNLPLLFALAFVSEALLILSVPSRDATVPDLVPPGSLAQANGIIMASSFGMLPLGAVAFAGFRLAADQLTGFFHANPLFLPFLFDSVTFLVAAALFATLPRAHWTAARAPGMVAEVAEAWRVARRNTAIRGLAVGVAVAMFGGGVLFALGIGFVRQTLGAGDVEFGILASLWGVGMALGLGVVRFLVREAGGEPMAFRSAVSACGVSLVAMAFVPVTWIAFLVAVVFGMAFSMAVMLALAIVQREAGERARGRILGGAQLLFRLGLALGALGIGGLAALVDRLSVGPVVLDGNRFGLLLGGLLILLGSVASRGVSGAPTTSPGGPPGPGPA
jgi:MFS family permease